MDNGFKKYVVIEYDGLSDEIYLHFFETDIKEDDDEFYEIIDNFIGNNSNTIVVSYEKFLNTIIRDLQNPKFEIIKSVNKEIGNLIKEKIKNGEFKIFGG